MNEILKHQTWRSTTGQLCYRIDNSGLGIIKQCPRKAYYKLVLRRTPAGARPALDFGKAIHAALEGPVSGLTFGAALHEALEHADKTEPSVERAMEALDKAFAGMEVPEDEYRTLGRAREVIAAYIKEWAGDKLRVLSVEKPFCVPLGRIEGVIAEPVYVFWAGKIDKIALNHNDTLWVVDHKTGAKEGEKDHMSWENASQFKGYVFAMEQSLPGRKVEGAIIDRIIVRPPTATITKKTKPRNQFFRIPVRFSPETIVEWQQDTLRHISTWLTYCRDESFPMNDGSCADYGGCPFWNVCTVSDHSCRSSILNGLDFKNDEWDPLKP